MGFIIQFYGADSLPISVLVNVLVLTLLYLIAHWYSRKVIAAAASHVSYHTKEEDGDEEGDAEDDEVCVHMANIEMSSCVQVMSPIIAEAQGV